MAVNNTTGNQVSSPIKSGYYFESMEVAPSSFGGHQVAITFKVTKEDGTSSTRLHWVSIPAEDKKADGFASTIDSIARAIVDKDVYNAAKTAFLPAGKLVTNVEYAQWAVEQIKAVPDWNTCELEILYVYESNGKDADGNPTFKIAKDKDGNDTVYTSIPKWVSTTGTFLRRKGDESRPMELSKTALANVAAKDKFLESKKAPATSSETWG